MIGVNTGSVRLDRATKIVLEHLKSHPKDYYFGLLGSTVDMGNKCTCTKQQLHNYGRPCSSCTSRFDANRLAQQYANALTIRCNNCEGTGRLDRDGSNLQCHCVIKVCDICDLGRVFEKMDEGLRFYECDYCHSDYSDARQTKINKDVK